MGQTISLQKPAPIVEIEAPYYEKREKYWSSEPNAEKDIFYAKSGCASEKRFKAMTVPELLELAAKKDSSSPALCVERPIEDASSLPIVNGKPQIPPPFPLDKWHTWTYGEYLRDVKKLAKSMLFIGLQPTDSCNVFGFNSPEWVISQLAVTFAGGRVAGIYPSDTPEQIQFKVDHADGKVLTVDGQKNFEKVAKIVGEVPYLKAIVSWGELTSYKSLKNQKGEEVKVYSWESFLELGKDVSDEELNKRTKAIRPGQCACLIYTSGTTGNPKAVMLSHDNIVFEAYMVITEGIDNFGLKPEQERLISYLPLSHVAGMMVDIIAPLIVTAFLPAFATTYFSRPYDLKMGSLVERLQTVKPTMFLGVPRVWEKMADRLQQVTSEATGIKGKLIKWAMDEGLKYTLDCNYGGKGQMSLSYMIADKLVLKAVRSKLGLDLAKYTFTGAAPIQVETQRFLGCFGLNINEVYGMSEGTGGTSWSKDSCHLWGVAGYTMPGSELKIFQTDLGNINIKKPVPRAADVFNAKEEEQGEICSRGRNVMMGYMANPRLGKEHVEEIEKKNKEAIDDEGFLHSGDKGALSTEGFLKITGRFKELIIGAGGENIAPVPIEDNLKKVCPLISNAIMIGDKRSFNVVFIVLKLQGATGELPGTNILLPDAFKHLDTTSKTIEEAMSDPKVIKEVERSITETNKNGKVVISNACTIQKFMILPRDVSIETGELTATLKLKRNVVVTKFEKLIDRIYKSKDTYVKFPMEQFDEFYSTAKK